MNGLLAIPLAAALVALAGCGSSQPSSSPPSPTPNNQVVVQLTDSNGSTVGTATLTPASQTGTPSSGSATSAPSGSPSPTPVGLGSNTVSNGVHFHVVITALAPGSHGFQIHAVGKCDPPSFVSSGPLFNPLHHSHGFDNPQGPEAGDLPNIVVGTDGQGTADFTTNLVTLTPGQPASLSTTEGTSLVVDQFNDDQSTPPEGNSGRRIACGVIFAAQNSTPSPSVTAGATVTPTGSPTPKTSGAPTPSASPSSSGSPTP